LSSFWSICKQTSRKLRKREKKGKGDVTSSEERTKSDEFEYFSPRRTNEDASRKLAANPACFKG
jgi:hypothetical protein